MMKNNANEINLFIEYYMKTSDIRKLEGIEAVHL